MDDITPLQQLAAAMPDTLFKPAPAYRVARSSYPDTPVPPDEPFAENPPTGAIIDYYLARPASGPVTLEISDLRGTLIRRYTSTDPPDLTDDQVAKQLIPSYWVRPHRTLGTTAGSHRWVWDLRAERPLVDSYEYPVSAVPHDTPRIPEGPRVLPGSYTAKLTVNGKTHTATVEVKLDPRVKLTPASVAQQNQLEHRLATLVTRSARLVMEAQSTLDQLTKLAPKPDPLTAQAAAAAAKVTVVLSRPPLPKAAPGAPPQAPPATLRSVNGKLTTLYKMIEVDAPPTAVQIAETTQADRELVQLAKTWAALQAGELAQLNPALTAAGLPAIHPELAPETRQANGEEE
jgi:hypothetical protein